MPWERGMHTPRTACDREGGPRPPQGAGPGVSEPSLRGAGEHHFPKVKMDVFPPFPHSSVRPRRQPGTGM